MSATSPIPKLVQDELADDHWLEVVGFTMHEQRFTIQGL
jgi:hypothetical protein